MRKVVLKKRDFFNIFGSLGYLGTSFGNSWGNQKTAA